MQDFDIVKKSTSFNYINKGKGSLESFQYFPAPESLKPACRVAYVQHFMRSEITEAEWQRDLSHRCSNARTLHREVEILKINLPPPQKQALGIFLQLMGKEMKYSIRKKP